MLVSIEGLKVIGMPEMKAEMKAYTGLVAIVYSTRYLTYII